MPASCPPAIVAIEREVPGNTPERIWQAPIQIACPPLMSSIFQGVDRRVPGGIRPGLFPRSLHGIDYPHHNAADQERSAHYVKAVSRFLPITLVSR